MSEPVNKLAEQMKRAFAARNAAPLPSEAVTPASAMPVTASTQASVVADRMLADQQDKDAVVLLVTQIVVVEQARKTFKNIEGLANSIRTFKQRQPIIVRQIAPHRFELVHGERRLLAIKSLNKDTILARIVRDEFDAKMIRFVQLTENVQREDYEPMELAREFAFLKREYSLLNKEIAEQLHISEGWVSKKLSLLEAPHEVQELIERGELSESEYYNNKASIEAKINSLHNSSSSEEGSDRDSKPPRADVRTPMLSIPIAVALKLAEWIKEEAMTRGTNPVELGDKPTKKELIAILSRVSELRG